MRAKPAVTLLATSLAAGLLLSGAGRPVRADVLPTLVLYPLTLDDPDDVRALVDLRRKLRDDGQFQVLTYNRESPAMTRAARDARHPEWLAGPMTSDADRLALARALGASFMVTVARADGRGKADAHLVEAAPSVRFWNVFNKKPDEAARAIEQQAADALAHPATVTARPPTPVAAPRPPAPVAAVVIPKPVIVAPPGATPPAHPVTPAPVTVAPPVVITPPAPVITPPAKPVTPPAPPPAPVTVIPPAPVITPTPAPVVVAPPVVTAPPSPRPMPAPVTTPAPVLVPPAALPIPTPPGPPVAVVPAPVRAAPPVDDLSGVKGILTNGDDELARGNFVGAIARYREAVNGAPLSVTPRLKLAQAYLQAEMRDKALDEARRALGVAPDSQLVQQFLAQLDAETGTSDGAVARYNAVVAQNPQDPTAHLELGDALWNNSDLTQAESEYKQAQTLAAPGSPPAQTAAAHLARLFAAQSRYDDSLAALKVAGAAGYALALGIVQSRADTLSSTLEAGQESFEGSKSTRADFYKAATGVSAQSQALSDFVVQVVPPPAFKLSHLYRVQATHLLAQQAAVLVTYIETSDAAQAQKAAKLGKEAQSEMLTAHAAEEKLGLWGGKAAAPTPNRAEEASAGH